MPLRITILSIYVICRFQLRIFKNLLHNFEKNIYQEIVSSKNSKSHMVWYQYLPNEYIYSLGGVIELVLFVLLVDEVEPKAKYISIVNICFVIFYLTCRCSNRACCLCCCCCNCNNQFFIVFIKLYKVDCKRIRIQVRNRKLVSKSTYDIFHYWDSFTHLLQS
jgi:hypothetical protein